MRTAKYIAESFGKHIQVFPRLIPDEEIKERLDISFCAVGGQNNLKTHDILEDENNTFFRFDWASNPAISVIGNSDLKYTHDGTYDYGYIIKITPKLFENRTWIGVAGLGEWGTSGAAWYLARNWKKIEKIYRNHAFGLIVKVKVGKDESAQPIYKSKS
jgi:hypothetical protein